MANDLTGDFDIIAEFALPAVNRVLAAMHRVERFPHTIAARVDDTPQPGLHIHPSIISVVDAFGDAPASQDSIGNPTVLGPSVGPSLLDPVVNLGNLSIGVSPIVPSNLKGNVQLQVFPPEIEVPDASGTHLTVSIGMLSRYFPDAGTSALAEYVRGDLRVTVPVNQVASQVGNVVEVDIKANNAVIGFTSQWSSKPISAEDMAGINQLIRNCLKTSFLPSNATLPSQISHMQFKTLSGSQKAVAVMLDMDGPAGNPSTANNVFLSAADGFAFGVGADYLRAALQPTLDNILSQPIDPVTIAVDAYLYTKHVTYTITLNTATLELQSGKMLFQITGHAHTGTSWMPDFDFTVSQDLTLSVTGDSAQLVIGNMSFDTSSWVVNLFKGGATTSIAKVRDQALAQSDAQDTVRKMLSASGNLGGFLNSLLKPASGATNTQPLSATLIYTSAEIRTSGIVLHGSAAVPAWTPPDVEFEQIPVSLPHGPGGIGGAGLSGGPDYSALNTWIPGGKISSYSWHLANATQDYVEYNRFVYISEPATSVASAAIASSSESSSSTSSSASGSSATGAAAAVKIPPLHGYNPMCLTVNGTRPSASGVVTTETVSAKVCAGLWFPIGGSNETAMMAIARKGNGGNVEVTGHAPTSSRIGGYDSPNVIVYFADGGEVDNLALLSRALDQSGRDDAPTAIVVVMSSARLAATPWMDGLIYAEDDDGAWRKRYGLPDSRQSTTIVANPDGHVLWKADGRIDAIALADALRKVLVRRGPVRPVIIPARTRIGHAAPNFLFEYSPGQELTLRTIAGRSAILVFWRSLSAASVDALRAAAASSKGGPGDPLVFAINDGDDAEVARRLARDVGPAVTIVPDPDRKISDAYGVTMWPTTILLDEGGVVRSIQYGRASGGKGHA
jgi:hypothetical protein